MIKQKLKSRINRFIDSYLEYKLQSELLALKDSFKTLGKNFNLGTDFIIKNPKYIEIGDNFYAIKNIRIEAWDEYEGDIFIPKIIIGNNVVMNTDIHIGAINEVVLEDNVMLASRIYISDHSHGNVDTEVLNVPPTKRKLISKGSVIIRKNVWIGEGVCILPNVEIGENTIIGANAVVTKSFGPNLVIGGIPAKVLKDLN